MKAELEIAFCGGNGAVVRVGSIRQDSTIPAMVRVDELLGKHFAVLGTTGTGKSCTTALILRSILEKNPAAHIVLLDPHNEYATAFTEWAEVISPRNMQLPFWLLTFEELIEVLVGDGERKAETEVLQDLIPVAKNRYSTSRSADTQRPARRPRSERVSRSIRRSHTASRTSFRSLTTAWASSKTREIWRRFATLKHRIETISRDSRYSFMFGSVTVYDGMAQVLSRIFRVPVNNKPITILELTGIPSEIVNVVVSVLCRMTFDFALWSEGQVPVTLVCEEAHRYVPANAAFGFEPCKRAIAKIAKEGRKYGASLCIVTQRPAEIDPTILSQCNTVFALRMSNERDQAIVASAVADTGSGLLEFLPSLGEREAIAFGDGMSLPVRIKFDELPKHALPRSSTARFSERWQKSLGDEGFLDQIVERWRALAIPAGADTMHNLSMMADAIGLLETGPLDEALRDALTQRPNLPPPAPTSGAERRWAAAALRRSARDASRPHRPDIKRRATPNSRARSRDCDRPGRLQSPYEVPAATNPGSRDEFVAIAPRAINAPVLNTPTAPGAIFALNFQ